MSRKTQREAPGNLETKFPSKEVNRMAKKY